MTQKEIKVEEQYRLAKAIFAALEAEGLISREKLETPKKACANKWQPMIGTLEVNGIAGEKDYQGTFYPET